MGSRRSGRQREAGLPFLVGQACVDGLSALTTPSEEPWELISPWPDGTLQPKAFANRLAAQDAIQLALLADAIRERHDGSGRMQRPRAFGRVSKDTVKRLLFTGESWGTGPSWAQLAEAAGGRLALELSTPSGSAVARTRVGRAVKLLGKVRERPELLNDPDVSEMLGVMVELIEAQTQGTLVQVDVPPDYELFLPPHAQTTPDPAPDRDDAD